ncbi:hypothetical protein IU399_02210 [Salmonella enterica subsp. enterica serovar Worthington]|nr:hypothetical protein [Salmonella enterica subsp. enterica serovar Worthington]
MARMQMKHGRKLVIALPYIWLILLFLLPFLIVFKISWRKWRGRSRRIPICWNGLTVSCRLRSISVIFATDRRSALFRSLSAIVTNCRYFHNLLPAAGLPAGVGGGAQQALHAQYPAAVGDPALVDVFLIRVYADGHFEKQRCAEQCVAVARVIDQPLTILHTNTAVYIGIVYAYLPFMVLPIYTALTRIDYSLVEASLDLGARPLKTFLASLSRSPKAESSPARCWFLSRRWESS